VIGSDGTVASSGPVTGGSANIPGFNASGNFHVQSLDSSGAVIADDIITSTGPTCAAGGFCAVGDTGPGGGVIFSVDSSTPALVYETAPKGWSGTDSDPIMAFGDIGNAVSTLNEASGSKGDWFAGNRWEMRSLLTNASVSNKAGIQADRYWTNDTDWGTPLIEYPANHGDYFCSYGVHSWYEDWTQNALRPMRKFTVSAVAAFTVSTPPTTTVASSGSSDTTPTTEFVVPTTEAPTTTVAPVETGTVTPPEQPTVVDGGTVQVVDVVNVITAPDQAPLVVGDAPQTIEIPAAAIASAEQDSALGITSIEASFDGVSWMPVSATSGYSQSVPAGATKFLLRVKTKSGVTKVVTRTFAATQPKSAVTGATGSTVASSDSTATADTSANSSSDTTIAAATSSSTSSSSNTGMIAIIGLVVAALAGAGFALSKRNRKK
jgi:hypothetical protein